MTLDSYMFSNEGGRQTNEDCVAMDFSQDRGMFVLADGLGGHQLGEMASRCVCESLMEAWGEKTDGDVSEWLKDEIAIANQRVIDLQKEQHVTMKSTVVTLVIDAGKATWANVGDSRLYYFHDRRINCYTEDHSVSYKKYKAGEITRIQLSTDEDQSCLLRTLGSPDRNMPDVNGTDHKLEPGDAFLLCSDGFWEYVLDQEMLIDLHKAESAEEWANLLLLRAIKRVGKDNDNISVMTVLVTDDSGEESENEN